MVLVSSLRIQRNTIMRNWKGIRHHWAENNCPNNAGCRGGAAVVIVAVAGDCVVTVVGSGAEAEATTEVLLLPPKVVISQQPICWQRNWFHNLNNCIWEIMQFLYIFRLFGLKLGFVFKTLQGTQNTYFKAYLHRFENGPWKIILIQVWCCLNTQCTESQHSYLLWAQWKFEQSSNTWSGPVKCVPVPPYK